MCVYYFSLPATSSTKQHGTQQEVTSLCQICISNESFFTLLNPNFSSCTDLMLAKLVMERRMNVYYGYAWQTKHVAMESTSQNWRKVEDYSHLFTSIELHALTIGTFKALLDMALQDMAMTYTSRSWKQCMDCWAANDTLRMTLQRWFAFPNFLTENKHGPHLNPS